MINQRKHLFIWILLLSVALSGLTGCEPFRKKFVRKKKEDRKEKFIPVLDPIDYPAKMHTAEDQYKYSYSLWKVWSTDYLKSLEERDGDKKQKYALIQSLKALEDMKNVVNADKKSKLDELIKRVSSLNNEYEKSVSFRSLYQMKSNMEKVMSQIRNELNPKLMTDQYAPIKQE
jgi:hypothetical protein